MLILLKKSTFLPGESNNSLQLLFGDFTRSCHTAVALKIHTTFRHVCVTKAAIGVEASVCRCGRVLRWRNSINSTISSIIIILIRSLASTGDSSTIDHLR